MFKTLIIFALWIGGGHVLPISGKSVAASTFTMTDITKKTDKMTKRKTVSELKADFRKVHGDRYDYSLITEYKNNKQPLLIICKEHGAFPQSANSHLRGCGCPRCADKKTGDRCRMTLEVFLQKAKLIHGDKYDYSLINKNNFIDSHHEVPIMCKEHGLFFKTPKDLLSGRGCYHCGKESMAAKQRYSRDNLVSLFNEIFNGKYDYSLFNEDDYKNKKTVITVICPEHGAFKVSVDNHLYRHSGCPSCKRSVGEEAVAEFLSENGIEYITQHKIVNESLLCENKKMLIDFYLPKLNTMIEFNGIQHYKEISFFNERTFDEQQCRDEAVRFYCKNHGIKLIEIPYTEIENVGRILKRRLKV